MYQIQLKEKYCNEEGVLADKYPTFYQFRYYYRKNKNMQKYYISRDGIKSYQRNNRPLTGDKIQEYAPAVGVGMFDSTICDIYLVNEAGELVGRPILTACIDAYSSLCCGYTLSWEGGMYSLRSLVLNVITDKVQWCEKFGVTISKTDWDCNKLPATFVTDMGSEYVSENFEQISELGVTVVNLPSYRPELKGAVEKFFDLIQESYKPYLKGKGVIEPDYLERGAHDYRKDACLTLETFEKIILHCIIYYNSKRIIENFPYTEEMLSERVKPHASDIWNWGKNQIGANLIKTSSKDLMLTLLPRTTGKFSRFGLKVNKLRYHNEGYTEEYLKGNSVTVAYNLDDVTSVWVVDKGKYTQFELIDSRFEGKNIDEVSYIQDTQKEIIKYAHDDNIQAKILLAEHIEAIANTVSKNEEISIKGINSTKKKERNKRHIDHMKEGEQYELYY